MARFRLKAAHYLYIGEEWEREEVARNGRARRTRYRVATLLDPDPESPTYTADRVNREGDIIITTKEDPRFKDDILCHDSPSQEMEPLDDEAVAMISALPQGEGPMSQNAFPTTMAETAKPIDNAKSDALADFRKQLAEMNAAMALLKGQNDELAAQNKLLMSQLEASEAPPPPAPAAGLRLGA